MKKLKLIVVLLIVLLTSGCSVEYNLTLNEDNTISETIIAKDKTDRIESLTNLKGKQAVTYLYDMFKREDENIKFNYRQDDTYTHATASMSYDNVGDYTDNFKSDVFSNIELIRDNDLVTIKADQSELLNKNESYSLIYDDITINIEIPYEVTKNNADKIRGNVYTWYVKESKDLKRIEISYKESSKIDSVNVKINDKMYNINYGIIALSVIILVVGLIVIFVYHNNKKNNIV